VHLIKTTTTKKAMHVLTKTNNPGQVHSQQYCTFFFAVFFSFRTQPPPLQQLCQLSHFIQN